MQFLDPKIDVAFKELFGSEDQKNLTIAFLNAILEYTGDRQIEDIQFLNTEQLPIIAAKKESILDISCRDKSGRRFIIEMQNAWEAGFVKRIQWYGARAYTYQLNAKKPYLDLEPVVVVAIIKSFVVFPHKVSYKSIHETCDRKTGEHDLGDLTFAFVELKKFKKTQQELVTNEDKWLFLLRDIALYNHIPEALQEAEFRQACESLNRGTWDEYKFAQYEEDLLNTQSAEETARRLLKAEESSKEQSAKIEQLEQSSKEKDAKVEKLEQNLRESKRTQVRMMLAFNCELSFIAQSMGVSLEEVQKIADEIKKAGSAASNDVARQK